MLHIQDTPTRVRDEKITKQNIIDTKKRVKHDSSCLTRGLISTQQDQVFQSFIKFDLLWPMVRVLLSK